jgi:hypothetical protein
MIYIPWSRGRKWNLLTFYIANSETLYQKREGMEGALIFQRVDIGPVRRWHDTQDEQIPPIPGEEEEEEEEDQQILHEK